MAEIEESIAVKLRGALRNRAWRHAPTSKNAVKESPGVKGGYDAYLQELVLKSLTSGLEGTYTFEDVPFLWSVVEERILDANRHIPAFPGKDSLVNRLLRTARTGIARTREEYVELLKGFGTLLSMQQFYLMGSTFNNVPVHVATPLAEQGCKVRVITVPPAAVFTAGDIVRKAVFPRLRKKDRRLRDINKRISDDGVIDGLNYTARGDWQWLSADLTKATDGFGHGAIEAAVRGLERAGLSPLYAYAARQSLGIAEQKHYVRYRKSSFTKTSQWEEVAALGRVGEEGGAQFCDVPMNRGCLMGTPFSFTILSLLNGVAAEVLGPATAITGDDVVSLTLPHRVRAYGDFVQAMGSGLHSGKSFFGKKGWTFCEVFALSDGGGPPRAFNPYPLKQFMRDGNGVLDKGKYFAPQWKALRRVARVLCKGVRAKARRLRRPPELPVALGGLGHPSKGMRDMPKAVRAQLYELVIGQANPSKYAARVDIFFSPADRRQFEDVREELMEDFDGESLITGEEPPEGTVRVSNRVLRAHCSRIAHETYWAHGGRYRQCRPGNMKPGTLKLPPPGPRQFDRRSPWTHVLDFWREKLDLEGRAVPIDVALEIRGFTPPSAATTVRGGREHALG
jgi:hypothetical protein